MVRRTFSTNPDEDYYRLAENIHNERGKYIESKKDFVREYAEHLRRLPIGHAVKRKTTVEKVWKDYKTIAQAEILEKVQEGKTVKKSKRKYQDFAKYDLKGRIKLIERK